MITIEEIELQATAETSFPKMCYPNDIMEGQCRAKYIEGAKWMLEKIKVGKMYPASAMFLRWEVGEMDVDGEKFEITTNAHKVPLITSQKTGKTFMLSWEDITKLAIQNGVNDEKLVE
jgi:hypothetical protein